MPMILAPGKLRRKVVKNLRTMLERELLLALILCYSGRLCFKEKKKKPSLNAWLHAAIKYFLSMTCDMHGQTFVGLPSRGTAVLAHSVGDK